ncbi:MAG: chemotaxis protein [Prolixibacteraceae bacterium]|nr:MAG: chemotaxis protein [Prolixibacteraceae bacterium]
MKTRNLMMYTIVLLLFLGSCKPIYQCGQPVPEKNLLLSKRIKAVIAERDSLCTTLAARDNEIVSLKDNIESLKNNIAGLNQSITDIEKKYNELSGAKLSEAEQFNLALKQKTEELNFKERLLKEREQALNELRDVIARQDSITKRLNDVIRNALLGFNSDELSVEVKNGKVYVSMSDKLLFKSGSAAVETKGKEAIKVLAGVLDKNRDIDILIEGHTDNVPIKTAVYRDNWDLSVARATSIVRILTDEYKIEPTRLTASGKGEFSPRATNETPEDRALNRRTEIILSPKLDEIMQLLKTN